MDFLVQKNNIKQIRTINEKLSALETGFVRLRTDKFALTSNNITYAIFGDMMNYWSLFPSTVEGCGRIPVWGFAEVIESCSDDVTNGKRVFGFLPISTVFDAKPGKVNAQGFTDVVEYRNKGSPIYNTYSFTESDPYYKADREEFEMVFRPLFSTAFLIDDFIADQNFFDSNTVIISSASSKTAIAAAFMLHQRDGINIVGLTSKSNKKFLETIGCYSKVVAYEDISSLPKDNTVYVDIAGNGNVAASVHGHFAQQLKYSMLVGKSHWNSSSDGTNKINQEFFFAPNQSEKRLNDWGSTELQNRIVSQYEKFFSWSSHWIQFQYVKGPQEIEKAYRNLLEGFSSPSIAYICSF